jgi:diguanylate cyclase (GGDEF)-like protein
MSETYLLSISIFLTIISIYYVFWTKKHNSFKYFLDIQTNILMLSTDKELTYINKRGLKFFGVDSIKEFKRKYNNLPNLFIEEKGCFSKYTMGKKWLTNIYKEKQQIKVKLKTDLDKSFEYYFYIHLTKLKKDHYLLSFTNITKLERDKELIRRLADYDSLTRIYNRVKFNEIFPIFLEKNDRYNEIFSIILFDIDHFKLINDNQGHHIGDRVLVELASLVKQKLRDLNIRKTSLFSRWGGEEFIILVQSKKIEEAQKIANILRKDISEYHFPKVGRVTCSFGVTEVKSNDNQIDIFHRADKALYKAKENGRNQVVMLK